MNPDPALYGRWVRAVSARIRPQIDLRVAALRAEVARLREPLARPIPQVPTAAEEAALRAECTRLEEELAALDRSVERAEQDRADELRARVVNLLTEANSLLDATEAEHWRTVCREADRLFAASLLRPAESLSVNDVENRLRDSTHVAEVRAALTAGTEEAARQMATTAGALDLLRAQEARRAECRRAVTASQDRLLNEHGVARAVLDALPGMAADRSIHSALDDLIRDARTEAAWVLSRRDVLAQFRDH